MLNRYRTATGFTQGMADAWQISSHETEYDMSTHSPTITAKARPAMVEIGGKKPGFTSMDIQARVDGTEEWVTIGVKVNHLPFIDSRPSANGKPEKREYRGLGYDGDQQVGQPSPIVTAVWGL
jgi:hypothetical protein